MAEEPRATGIKSIGGEAGFIDELASTAAADAAEAHIKRVTATVVSSTASALTKDETLGLTAELLKMLLRGDLRVPADDAVVRLGFDRPRADRGQWRTQLVGLTLFSTSRWVLTDRGRMACAPCPSACSVATGVAVADARSRIFHKSHTVYVVYNYDRAGEEVLLRCSEGKYLSPLIVRPPIACFSACSRCACAERQSSNGCVDGHINGSSLAQMVQSKEVVMVQCEPAVGFYELRSSTTATSGALPLRWSRASSIATARSC